MRRILWLVLACSLISSGCSFLIAGSGMNVHRLTTRQDFHREFGPPSETGTEAGQVFEEFHTRRKISEPFRASHLGMEVTMSLGLGEFIAFPWEVYRLGSRTLLGQTLRVTYDPDGRVSRTSLDGERLIPWPPDEVLSPDDPQDSTPRKTPGVEPPSPALDASPRTGQKQ
jgi:YD repeat-containing protein